MTNDEVISELRFWQEHNRHRCYKSPCPFGTEVKNYSQFEDKRYCKLRDVFKSTHMKNIRGMPCQHVADILQALPLIKSMLQPEDKSGDDDFIIRRINVDES